MKVLVTGHEGFLGRNLAAHLRDQGHEVAGMDFASSDRAERVDIRDRRAVRETLSRVRPEAVVHLAALASVPACEKDPEYAHEVNLEGTRNIASACQESGSRLVFMSSAAVYGNPSVLPTPTSALISPVNVYGTTKARAETVIRELLPDDAVIFRLFNAYGERCDRSYVIPDVIRKALSRMDPVPMQGLGTESRDFIYVRDVVAAVEAAIQINGAGTYNLGTGRTTTIRGVAEAILRTLSVGHQRLRFADATRLGDFRISWADLSDGNSLAGWRPRWPLEEGLRHTVAYYLPRLRAETQALAVVGSEGEPRASRRPQPVPVMMVPAAAIGSSTTALVGHHSAQGGGRIA